MALENKIKKEEVVKKSKKWLIAVSAIFLFILLAGVSAVFGYQYKYDQKIFPGVKVSYLDLGGMDQDQALNQLKSIEDNLKQKGLHFVYRDKDMSVSPMMSSTDPDLAKPILTFEWSRAVAESFRLGRQGNFLQQVAGQFRALVFGQNIKLNYYLDESELLKSLQSEFSSLEQQPVNAQLKIENGKPEIIPEQEGYIFDYQKAINQLKNQIASLNFSAIKLDLVYHEPTIKRDNVGSALNSLDNVMEINELILKAEDKTWTITKEKLVDWLDFTTVDNEIVIGINQEKISEYLKQIATEIDVSAQDAKFELKSGRVTAFQASVDGKELKIEDSYRKINQQVISGQGGEIDLVVGVALANVATNDINELGIKELIGTGQSNFAGSPKNRRINIAVGAQSLNGILIAPDEEFSLMKALGDIDGEHGYKQELVIKGNRTVPEYGGGLCQIGTTTFRAALNSGLPIIERRNHSYRVVYYEPAGMDATIYSPAPDLKFLNDTGHYILFTTKVSGDELIFQFYGTKDGRVVKLDPNPPKIYNVTGVGQPKYIETEELKPGEKRKIESAHRGADTYFKYTVTYTNGDVKEKEFYSHYIPWQEVWLVGKELVAATTTAPIDGTAPEAVAPAPTN